MKKVFHGWVGRQDSYNFEWMGDPELMELHIPDVFNTKGEQPEWMDDDWPPNEVTITVEVKEEAI